MNKILKLTKKHWKALIGLALGALGGYLYWYFVGCNSGSCPITSSPLKSSLWGAAVGVLVCYTFKKEQKHE